jgi:DNA-binding response OmpR family regulator
MNNNQIVLAFLCADNVKFNAWSLAFCDLDFTLKAYHDDHALFRGLVNEEIYFLVIDDASTDINEKDIARYLVLNPELIVICIVDDGFDNARKVLYLDLGVDRILVNPVASDLLRANILASTRSCELYCDKPINVLELNNDSGWILSVNGWVLTAPSGKSLQLTAREFQLLNILALKPGETINKHLLAEQLLGEYGQNGSRRMTLLMARLRKKVIDNLGCELPITTVHSIGYACVLAMTIK